MSTSRYRLGRFGRLQDRAGPRGRRYTLPGASTGGCLRASQKRKIADRYAASETMAELAREYECREATIWRALQPAA
jgi:hypothetical protein